MPSRRGHPGYLYSDLRSRCDERCGSHPGAGPGSITEVPVLTMPGSDITHPVPDVTGYITEGQLVLSAELHAAGISAHRTARVVVPPDAPAGPGRTRDDHLELAAQLVALLAKARDVRELTEVFGEAALSQTDRLGPSLR